MQDLMTKLVRSRHASMLLSIMSFIRLEPASARHVVGLPSQYHFGSSLVTDMMSTHRLDIRIGLMLEQDWKDI